MIKIKPSGPHKQPISRKPTYLAVSMITPSKHQTKINHPHIVGNMNNFISFIIRPICMNAKNINSIHRIKHKYTVAVYEISSSP